MADDAKTSEQPTLLTGGNPQIPKGEGPKPVADYIAAMPGWKQAVGQRIDELIVETVPSVRKAVKWNQPLYGLGDEGYHLTVRCYTKYLQVAFLRGSSLDPLPPKGSKHPEMRYWDIHEDDELDEAQLVSWVEQSAALPGETM